MTPADAPNEGPSTITAYMAAGHAALDTLLGDVVELVSQHAIDEATAAFRSFAVKLRRHIRIEEELIFPLMQPIHPHDRWGPTFVMHMEHVEILEIIEEMEQAISHDDVRTFAAWTNRLRTVLATHEAKEMQVLFPEADERVDDETRAALLAKIRSM